jgi:uncharacterized membrane protein YdjX (TVP38/TMEM64 family)
MNTRDPPTPGAPTPADPLARRLEVLPLAGLVLALAAFLAAGGDHRLTLEALRADAPVLAEWAASQGALATLAYVGAAFAAAALSVPGWSLVAMAGGVLFPPALGAVLHALGAAAGACVLMLAVRSAVRPMLRRRHALWLIAAEQALQRDGFWIVLALRLAFPFVPLAVTLGTAALGVRLRPFALASALGGLPGAYLLAAEGAALAARRPAHDAILLAWPVWPIGLGLALLALSPIVVRAMRQAR